VFHSLLKRSNRLSGMVCSPDRALLHQTQDAGAASDGAVVDPAAVEGAAVEGAAVEGAAVEGAAVDGAGDVAAADDEPCEPAPVWAPQPVKAASRIAPAAHAYLCFLMRSPPSRDRNKGRSPAGSTRGPPHETGIRLETTRSPGREDRSFRETGPRR
jgi:hypothetical protein